MGSLNAERVHVVVYNLQVGGEHAFSVNAVSIFAHNTSTKVEFQPNQKVIYNNEVVTVDHHGTLGGKRTGPKGVFLKGANENYFVEESSYALITIPQSPATQKAAPSISEKRRPRKPSVVSATDKAIADLKKAYGNKPVTRARKLLGDQRFEHLLTNEPSAVSPAIAAAQQFSDAEIKILSSLHGDAEVDRLVEALGRTRDSESFVRDLRQRHRELALATWLGVSPDRFPQPLQTIAAENTADEVATRVGKSAGVVDLASVRNAAKEIPTSDLVPAILSYAWSHEGIDEGWMELFRAYGARFGQVLARVGRSPEEISAHLCEAISQLRSMGPEELREAIIEPDPATLLRRLGHGEALEPTAVELTAAAASGGAISSAQEALPKIGELVGRVVDQIMDDRYSPASETGFRRELRRVLSAAAEEIFQGVQELSEDEFNI